MSEIIETEGVLGGKPRVEGTRVSAEQIYEMHIKRGMSPSKIAEALPTVDIEDVEAAIRFMKEQKSSNANVVA
jgi:uncharacterized protein (DUF433 family)